MFKQVLKKCGTCSGAGHFAIMADLSVTAGDCISHYEVCPTCKGRGMEETNTFIDCGSCDECFVYDYAGLGGG